MGNPNISKKNSPENLTNLTPSVLVLPPRMVNKPAPSKRKNNSLLNSLEPRILLLNLTKNLNVLSMKKAKLKPPLPMPCKLAVTITTFSVNNTRKNKNPKLNSNVLCPKLTLKSLNGEPSTKPMLSNVLKNSKKPRRSSLPNSKKWKKLANLLKPNALLLRRPSNVKLVKSKISKLILNAPTQPLLLLTRNNETSTRFLLNTNKKKKNSKLNLNLLKKNPDLFQLNSSKPRMLTKKLLTASRP